jgi:hypothetical protein
MSLYEETTPRFFTNNYLDTLKASNGSGKSMLRNFSTLLCTRFQPEIAVAIQCLRRSSAQSRMKTGIAAWPIESSSAQIRFL